MVRRCVALGLALWWLALPVLAQEAARPAKRDINKATLEELMAVRGVGRARAERILAFIREHGPLSSMEELLQVKGVGPATLRALREHFEVKAPPHH